MILIIRASKLVSNAAVYNIFFHFHFQTNVDGASGQYRLVQPNFSLPQRVWFTARNHVSRNLDVHPSSEQKHAIGASTFVTPSVTLTSRMVRRSCNFVPTNV